jgi:hypothetical protein
LDAQLALLSASKEKLKLKNQISKISFDGFLSLEKLGLERSWLEHVFK